MSINSPPELKSLFETALNEFEKRAGTNLIHHQIINKFLNCESADSVISIIQEQAQAFRSYRGDDGKLMTWLKRTVNVLYTLSISDMLCESISLVCLHSFLWHPPCNILRFQPFPPAKAVFAGIAVLLGVRALHGSLESILVTPVVSVRQSKILARVTMLSSNFSSLSNLSSGASTSIQRSHPPRR
jgi:hypothetical protein